MSGEWGGEQQEQGPQTGQRLSKADKRRARRSKKGEDRQPEPPLLPSQEKSKAKRVLYVACEGESTEPDYLNYLNEQYGESVPHPFRIQPVTEEDGLIPARAVAAVRDRAAGYETWALFDRDRHNDIPQALKEAAADGTEICFSHPSFDLWLLLHFKAFGGSQGGSSTVVHEKLRKADPAYKRFDKGSGKGVQGERRTALRGKAKTAIDNARSLVGQCESGNCKASRAKPREAGEKPPVQSSTAWAARSGHSADCPVLNRDPSTDVWRLLVSLGIDKADD